MIKDIIYIYLSPNDDKGNPLRIIRHHIVFFLHRTRLDLFGTIKFFFSRMARLELFPPTQNVFYGVKWCSIRIYEIASFPD